MVATGECQPLPTIPGTNTPAIDPEAERAASLAEAHGLDGDVFRKYLLQLVPEDPAPPPVKKELEAQILMAPRIIAKIRQASQQGDVPPHYVPLTDVANVTGLRTFSIKRTLESLGKTVPKYRGKRYCDPAHAAIAFEAWRKHWEKRQENA